MPWSERSRCRPGPADAEKITINLGYVDLGQIDLLVQEGFYSNRTDFIRTAIRNQLAQHGDAVAQAVARKTLVLGLQHLQRAPSSRRCARAADARDPRARPRQHRADVTPELALATIGSIIVLGALHASPAVKAALADRIR